MHYMVVSEQFEGLAKTQTGLKMEEEKCKYFQLQALLGCINFYTEYKIFFFFFFF